MQTASATLPPYALSVLKKQSFFISQLNRSYCAKSHLQERLPEIRAHAHFTDLAHAITETMTDVENQIIRMEQIFRLLGTEPRSGNCPGMTGLIDETFNAIDHDREDPESRDLAILFYLQNVETMEMASFKMLNAAVPAIATTEIRLLLQQNFDEASDDLYLLRLIMRHYFKK